MQFEIKTLKPDGSFRTFEMDSHYLRLLLDKIKIGEDAVRKVRQVTGIKLSLFCGSDSPFVRCEGLSQWFGLTEEGLWYYHGRTNAGHGDLLTVLLKTLMYHRDDTKSTMENQAKRLENLSSEYSLLTSQIEKFLPQPLVLAS